MKILILCTGNSCRSQMAHGILQALDKNLEVHSAGTHPAAQVNPLAIDALAEIGIDISSHTPQNINAYSDQAWDYLITVCGSANETCPTFTGKVTHRLHIGLDDPSTTNDPNEFRRVRNQIQQKFTELYLSQISK
ncbi:MAG: arsenate reductase ArsC [Paludibacteraceae bacterium]|nr:arsenate reductase ArsC [Paludibacteraceae bacterium]